MMSPNTQAAPHTLHIETHGQQDKPQIILLHGIATNQTMWKKLIASLQHDYFIVGIDLLGHGKSPKPKNIDYSADTQAQAIHRTLEQAGLLRPSMIIGFSIGALIAARFTVRYSELATANIFIAPPVYRANLKKSAVQLDNAYFGAYNFIQRLPEPATLRFLRAVRRTLPVLIGNNEFNDQTWHPIMSSLTHTVQRQSFANDLALIPARVDVTILHGRFDHVVVKSQLRSVTASRPKTKFHTVAAPHAFTKNYLSAIERIMPAKTNLIPAQI